jgi:hypothetical protein
MLGPTTSLRVALTLGLVALLLTAPTASGHRTGSEQTPVPGPAGLMEGALFGSSVAMSSDGFLIGAPGQSAGAGAAWAYRGSGEQELIGSGEIGEGEFGGSVALSADGTTALAGAPGNNKGVGAAFVFTRSGEVWTQQTELTGAGESGTGLFGQSVALSGDGSTALIVAPNDNKGAGAAWVFKRSGGGWAQQGPTLTDKEAEALGNATALSADGNTALIGAWVFTRSGEVWKQQGQRLKDAEGEALGATGALSGDGNTALLGAFVFTRSGGVWTQQGSRLKGKKGKGINFKASSPVALSPDGNTALLGEPAPFAESPITPAYVFRRSGATWSSAERLVCGGSCSETGFGAALALSADSASALVGAPKELGGEAFIYLLSRSVTNVNPNAGSRAGGITVTVTGTGFAPGNTMKFQFGKALAKTVNCSSTTTCTVVVPPSTKAKTVDVIAGAGSTLKSKKSPPGDHFTYT